MQLSKQKLGKYELLSIKTSRIYPVEQESKLRKSASHKKRKYGISFAVNKIIVGGEEVIKVTKLR